MPTPDPIARTAWYCCGARAQDARSPRPVCGDTLAERFMDADARALFERFPGLNQANITSAMRHRLIDEALRARLRERADQAVLLLGAGFDTRAFRLTGGHWMELDAPSLIAFKEQKLPAAECPNPLERIPIDFATERLADKLAPWAGRRDVVVVMEGVSMYLQPAQWQQTARTLHERLPGHRLMCDLIDATFVRRYGGRLRRALRDIGGEFAPLLDDPAAMVQALGYCPREAWSIVASAVEAGALHTPGWLLNSLLRSLRDGYRVHRLRRGGLKSEGAQARIQRIGARADGARPLSGHLGTQRKADTQRAAAAIASASARGWVSIGMCEVASVTTGLAPPAAASICCCRPSDTAWSSRVCT
jgi:methyltransferase (TIGR00027 family)